MTEAIPEDQMAIGPLDGYVILRFKAPMEQVAFPPEMALEVAESFREAAHGAKPSLKPRILTADRAELHRLTLTKRLEIILNSKRKQSRISNARLAQELVEICLNEVL